MLLQTGPTYPRASTYLAPPPQKNRNAPTSSLQRRIPSDRGWHYRTPDWGSGCRAAGIVRSMSRRGHSPDNAAMEAFFGRLKVELFHGRDWSGWTVGRFAGEPGSYISWYNSERLKSFPEGYDTIDDRRTALGLSA